MIKHDGNKKLYFDKNGTQIESGCCVRYPCGSIREVYLTSEGDLGIDATNPSWIKSGRAVECEYGIYPLTKSETEEIEVIKE